MIDIHSHILPKVDDGSRSMDMSIDMARIYLKNGIKKVIATPHYIERDSNFVEENQRALSRLNERLAKEKLELEVYLGNETYISMDILKDIEEERIFTMNNSRYILIELPMHDPPIFMDNILYELMIKGYIPIIAHPERNTKIIEDPNILYKYINKGALAQVNLPSLEGQYGKKVKNAAKILLKHNMIHFIGTDAHSNGNRSPEVEKALDILRSLISEEEFTKITRENGEKLLRDENIFPPQPREYKGKTFIDLVKDKINLF